MNPNLTSEDNAIGIRSPLDRIEAKVVVKPDSRERGVEKKSFRSAGGQGKGKTDKPKRFAFCTPQFKYRTWKESASASEENTITRPRRKCNRVPNRKVEQMEAEAKRDCLESEPAELLRKFVPLDRCVIHAGASRLWQGQQCCLVSSEPTFNGVTYFHHSLVERVQAKPRATLEANQIVAIVEPVFFV